jgi:hypothetical protein
MIVSSSRKKSPVTYSDVPLFFSLVDYRNNYFASDDPKKIMEFYDSFENEEQLIQWMKERPKGVANIHEVEGDSKIIVVIPTADFNGKYAKECKEKIFKGFHIIFVESGEVPDLYFNYAHNCNLGILAAMRYNPKWIVISNDDKISYDDQSKLASELIKVNMDRPLVVIPSNNEISRILTHNVLGSMLTTLFKSNDKTFKKESEFGVIYKLYVEENDLLRRLVSKVFFRQVLKMTLPGSFFIMNLQVCAKFYPEIFDETYINGMEDIDLFLRFYENNEKIATIDYTIHDVIGGSFGKSIVRYRYFGIANRVYFNFKNKDILSTFVKFSHNKNLARK